MYQLLVVLIPLIFTVVQPTKLGLYLLQRVSDVVSWSINCYLLARYPVSSCDHSRPRSIPTCPFRWPNGQGDTAKFLDGEENSRNWFHEYGRVYRIWSGMNPEVVLTTSEDIKTVFRNSDKHIKGVNNDAGWLMGEILGQCMGLVSGTEWQQLRASVGDAFTHRIAAANISRFEMLIKDHFAKLASQDRFKQGLLSPVEDLRFLPFWIITDYLYGELTPDLLSQLKGLIPLRESLFRRVIRGGLTRFSWYRYLPTSINRDLNEFKSKWREFNDVATQKRMKAPTKGMYEHVLKGTINIEHFLQTMDEILFANLDVTTGAISWVPLFLSANPNVQTELREEIKQARATGDRETWEKYIQSSETLLAASILESGRLKPLAAFSVPQASPTDCQVGGYLIPAGTNFVIDTHALNIRNPFWGDDQTEYRPSRFLRLKGRDTRYEFWRFGFGPRQCLGKYVAELIIRNLIVHLVANYQLRLAADSTWKKHPDTWITHPDTIIRCERLKSC